MKTIYLLIGAKGSGKSFIGKVFEQEFDIPFLRVEDIAKELRNDREITNKLYHVEIFAAIENGVRNFINKFPAIVFESTGLTEQFDLMFANLEKDYNVVTIGIKAEAGLCLKRVKARDQSIHINVSDDEINMINSEVSNKHHNYNYIIDNNKSSYEQLKNEIGIVISKTNKLKEENE